MKHARKDYNRIQDPEKKIPADEPVFLLRGQDRYAPIMLRIYANLVALADDFDKDIVLSATEQADAMDRWQDEKGCKEPDL